MQTSSRDLDERGRAAVDGIGEPEYQAGGDGGVVGKSTVGLAADETAGWTEIGLADAAMETGTAREDRVDDDAITFLNAGRRFTADQLADHLVAHDEWILGRYRAFEDFEIGPAESAVGDSHQDVAGWDFGMRNFVERQIAGRSED